MRRPRRCGNGSRLDECITPNAGAPSPGWSERESNPHNVAVETR
jgi:hypothetical protein